MKKTIIISIVFGLILSISQAFDDKMNRASKDEEGMKKSVTEGQRNPADFYENLTPAQKEKIKALGEKLNPGAQTRP